jgi:glyoxylase-like metal-dependent hydrolase (beta-lactamase superfamily II)
VDHRYFVEERHGDPEIATRVRGASNRIETFDESATPLPGVEVLHAPGHTPGSTVFVFASAGVRSVVLGDVVHSPVQLIEDEWNTPFDVDPQLARTTRKQLLRDLEDDPDVLLTAMHFPDMRFGRLVLVDGRRRWIV